MRRCHAWRIFVATSLAVAAGVALPATPAGAAIGDITTFTDPTGLVDQPGDLVIGPDGALWFVSTGNDRIGRFDPDTGVFTSYASARHIDEPTHLTVGTDGNIWFTNRGVDRIGRLDPDTGAVSSFADPAGYLHWPGGITVGPDGDVWVTNLRCLESVSPDGVITPYRTGPSAACSAGGGGPIVTSGDELWYGGGNRDLVRLNPATGATASYHAGADDSYGTGGVEDITIAPDGTIWFARGYGKAFCGAWSRVFTIDSASGQIHQQGETGCRVDVGGLVVTSDGSAWFSVGSDYNDGIRVGRIDPFGGLSLYGEAVVEQVGLGSGIVQAADGELWFTIPDSDQIGRVDPEGPQVRVSMTGPSYVGTGGVIPYQVTVRNTGTETLTGVALSAQSVPDCTRPLDDLAAGAEVVVDCSFQTAVGQSGYWLNTVSVDTDQTDSVRSNQVRTYVVVDPRLTISQRADEPGVLVGEPINYHVTVTNTGNIALTGVVLTDAQVAGCAGAVADIAVGAEAIVDCSHETTGADEGTFVNEVSVDTDRTDPISASPLYTQVGTQRSMAVDSSVDEDVVPVGATIHYHFTIENMGDIPLSGVALDGAVDDCDRSVGFLAAGASTEVDCDHVASAADIGTFTNPASAQADHLADVDAPDLDVTVAEARPDGRIQIGPTGASVGDDIYNTTGSGQAKRATVGRGASVKYVVTVENDAPFSDAVVVRGRGSSTAFSVRYLVGRTDVTGDVTAGTYRTATVAPGGTVSIKVVVTPTVSARAGARLDAKLTLRSTTHADRVDKVRFVTTRG